MFNKSFRDILPLGVFGNSLTICTPPRSCLCGATRSAIVYKLTIARKLIEINCFKKKNK